MTALLSFSPAIEADVVNLPDLPIKLLGVVGHTQAYPMVAYG